MRKQIDHRIRALHEPREIHFAMTRGKSAIPISLPPITTVPLSNCLNDSGRPGRAERRAAKRRDAMRDHQHQPFRMHRHRLAHLLRQVHRPTRPP